MESVEGFTIFLVPRVLNPEFHRYMGTHSYDLMAWLDQPFATPPDPQGNRQAKLAFV